MSTYSPATSLTHLSSFTVCLTPGFYMAISSLFSSAWSTMSVLTQSLIIMHYRCLPIGWLTVHVHIALPVKSNRLTFMPSPSLSYQWITFARSSSVSVLNSYLGWLIMCFFIWLRALHLCLLVHLAACRYPCLPVGTLYDFMLSTSNYYASEVTPFSNCIPITLCVQLQSLIFIWPVLLSTSLPRWQTHCLNSSFSVPVAHHAFSSDPVLIFDLKLWRLPHHPH